MLNLYIQQVAMYVGINIILTLSLNLVNGYMGEFSVGHAGFMAVGAYVASLLTVAVFPRAWGPFIFPVVLICGGLAAALAALLIAVPSFRTRGDYLAIVTLAFNMIVKSILENIDAVGGPRGYMGMAKAYKSGLGGFLGLNHSPGSAKFYLLQPWSRCGGYPGR